MAPTERLVAAGFTGKLVAGRYKLINMIGAGAVGEVWLAEHIHMRKRFALKIIDSRIAMPEIVQRFEREAVAAANITHPSVVAGTDFGRDEDGCFFLVLEYVAGVSLRKLVEAGPVAPKRALAMAKQILAAAGAAHAKGVVHRDLKPENVMLVERDDVDPRVATKDTVKVLDFGIAKVDPNTLGVKASIPPPSGQNLTRAGTIWGTPTYMAPEQAAGETVDPRADLYAVGVILYEMITGRPPFEGEPLEVIAKQIGEDAPPLKKKAPAETLLTTEVEAVVAALLKRNRDERPADVAAATEMIEAAERSYLEPPAGTVTEVQIAQRPSFVDRLRMRDRRAIAIVSAALMILVAVPLILVLSGSPPPVEDDESSRPKKKETTHAAKPSASAAPSASASAAPSTSSSVAATSTANKGTTSGGKNEKGFGKLKSLFK